VECFIYCAVRLLSQLCNEVVTELCILALKLKTSDNNGVKIVALTVQFVKKNYLISRSK